MSTEVTPDVVDQAEGDYWKLYCGDACEVIKGMPDRSVDLCIHSPPFSTLYIYSDSEADMGNSASNDEFFEHYRFLIGELYRVSKIGRICAVHCKDLPKYANRDDTAGLVDFPGECIRAFESCGWSYHSRVTIWKCPVTERERTNNNGLLHKTAERDRSQLRQGMADFLLMFRRPPDGTLMSEVPVAWKENQESAFREYQGSKDYRSNLEHPSPFSRKGRSARENGESIDIWRRYAEPVWWDIDQTDVLNYRAGREADDERHICPLQLGVIRRAVQIWSNPEEIVFSPFAGVGSEGYGAIQQGRRFVGIELKESYFRVAVKNLARAAEEAKSRRLF